MTEKSKTLFRGGKRIWRKPIPTTSEGLAPTITSMYVTFSPCGLYSVRHYPKLGILEVWEYEGGKTD